jgi:hypothetical protein
MLITLKTTKFIISNVEDIVIDEPMEHIEGELSERSISIRTYEGECYEISLQADALGKLKFVETSKDGWLTPKVYKGQSMHEQEMEEK